MVWPQHYQCHTPKILMLSPCALQLAQKYHSYSNPSQAHPPLSYASRFYTISVYISYTYCNLGRYRYGRHNKQNKQYFAPFSKPPQDFFFLQDFFWGGKILLILLNFLSSSFLSIYIYSPHLQNKKIIRVYNNI